MEHVYNVWVKSVRMLGRGCISIVPRLSSDPQEPGNEARAIHFLFRLGNSLGKSLGEPGVIQYKEEILIFSQNTTMPHLIGVTKCADSPTYMSSPILSRPKRERKREREREREMN